MSLFGRPTDPFQQAINVQSCHNTALRQYRIAVRSSNVRTRQHALRSHHIYLKQLLDNEAGYETDLFKSLKHIEEVVQKWSALYKAGDRKGAQKAVEPIYMEFRDTCHTREFEKLSEPEQDELLLDICLAYNRLNGSSQDSTALRGQL